MSAFVIVGTGGMGRELLGWIAGCAEETRRRYRVEAFISEAGDDGAKIHGVPVFSPDGWTGPPPRFVMAFADPVKKKRLALELEARGWKPETFVHDTAAVGAHARLGRGTVVCPFCRISTDCEIGEHVLVNGGSGVGHDARVGSYSSLLGSVSINGSSIVGEGVTFGAGSMVYPGKTVGDWATVGLASVVLRNVPAHATVYGNPARRISRGGLGQLYCARMAFNLGDQVLGGSPLAGCCNLMRFLILTTSHGLRESDQLMTNELVGALQRQGHRADVLLLAWQGDARGPSTMVSGPLGEDIVAVPAVLGRHLPAIAQRLIKWSVSPFKARRAFSKYFEGRKYDGVIAGTPAMLFGPALDRALRGGGRDRPIGILFIHDFFPIHHAEIGLIPQGAKGLLKKAEEWAMSKFDIIYCNLPSNMEYLTSRYRLTGDRLISWTPLWTRVEPVKAAPRAEVRKRYALPPTAPLAVFGGQLIEGRGIEDMLAAARLARERGSDLQFLFVGNGRLAPTVDRNAEQSGSNVRRISAVPRDDYLNLISACDVGMAATVPGVSSHSFPTKTMDYLRVGIPAVVTVEPGSSLATMLVQAGVGLSVPFGDIVAFADALETAVRDNAFRALVAAAARRFLDDVLDVDHVPGKITRDMARVTAERGDRPQ